MNKLLTNRVGKRIPHIADTKPGGRFHMTDIDNIGGIPVVMKHLLDAGLLHGDCMTVTGRSLGTELEAYNPLIPDGGNWKATFMLEYDDIGERRSALAKMIRLEDRVWVKVVGFDHVWAIADEDLARSNEEKTSSVHFLRFQLSPEMVAAVKARAAIGVGIEHEAYCHQVDPIPDGVRDSLAHDLD